MKRAIMGSATLAPSCCIVCGREHPNVANAEGWSYLAGATPVGAMACSIECTNIAIERHARTGKVDRGSS